MGTNSIGVMRARRLLAWAAAAWLPLWLGLAGDPAAAQGRPDLLWTEAGHSDAVTALDLSPDGAVLASSSRDRTVKLWRYPRGGLLRTLALPFDIDAQVLDVSMVRFTPDGMYVAAAVNQYDAGARRDFATVRVFRVGDGALVRTFARQGGRIASIDVSPDGLWLASAGQGGGARVWRLADGALVKALDGHPGAAAAVRFSPAGERLCVGYKDRHLVSWRSSDWALEWDVPAHGDDITGTVFSPAGTLVATTSLDGTARLFGAADGAPRFTLAVGTALYAAAFSPDGADLATGGLDATIRLWDAAHGTPVRQFAQSAGNVTSLRYADGGRILLSGSGSRSRIERWNPADAGRRPGVTRLAASVAKVAYAPDATLVAIAASVDQKVHVFDAANGRRRFSWNTRVDTRDVAFSPTEPLVAMPGPDNTVLVRRLSDGAQVRRLAGHAENVVGLAFSHDGALLASGSFFPGAIRLWRTSDWSLVREIKGGVELGAFGPFESFTFSPDDQLLGTIAEGAPLVVRTADGGVAAQPDGISRAAAFSPDGRLFVTSGSDNQDEVRIFRVGDWTLAGTLPTAAYGVAFSPDGQRLLAAHVDALRLWRTSDWTIVEAYDQELGYSGSGLGVQTATFAPDGARFAYGRDDATLAVARNPGR